MTGNDSNDSSGSVPTSSSALLDHQSSLNSLLLGSKHIPLLEAFHGSMWKNIKTDEWIKLLEEMFIAEKITADDVKINLTWRHIHTTQGSARAILSNNIDIKNATTWKDFSETALSLLTPPTDKNAFLACSNFSNITWNESIPLQLHISNIQRNLDKFLESIDTLCKVTFSERQRFVLLYAKLADSLPTSYNRFLLDNFDISLSVTQQQKKYLSKRDFNPTHVSVNALKQFTNKPKPQNKGNAQQNFSAAPNKPASQNHYGNFTKGNQIPQRQQQYKGQNTTPKIDPKSTPQCFNCERYGLYTKQCIFKPFCSLCFLYHPRGSQQKCYQTKWNMLTPQALMRFKSLPPPQPPQNYRHPQQGYWRQNSYSQYPKQNQAFNASYPRPQQQSFAARCNINHVQEMNQDAEGTHFHNENENSPPYGYSNFSPETSEYLHNSTPQFNEEFFDSYEQENYNPFMHQQNFQ